MDNITLNQIFLTSCRLKDLILSNYEIGIQVIKTDDESNWQIGWYNLP